MQYTPEETFDTLENRFVKLVLRILIKAIDKCDKYINDTIAAESTKNKKEDMENKRKTLSHLKSEIEQVLSGWIFNGVGNLNVNPSNSQVLIKQPGYKELLNIWRLLGMSYVPSFITSLEMAFELKRMDLLWAVSYTHLDVYKRQGRPRLIVRQRIVEYDPVFLAQRLLGLRARG